MTGASTAQLTSVSDQLFPLITISLAARLLRMTNTRATVAIYKLRLSDLSFSLRLFLPILLFSSSLSPRRKPRPSTWHLFSSFPINLFLRELVSALAAISTSTSDTNYAIFLSSLHPSCPGAGAGAGRSGERRPHGSGRDAEETKGRGKGEEERRKVEQEDEDGQEEGQGALASWRDGGCGAGGTWRRKRGKVC